MKALGRYEIRDTLGTGSMGTVYRAWDPILEREVALKTIRTEAGVDPELRERFYREARVCAQLRHPAIVVVYDFCEVEGAACIAMELLQGANFRQLIRQRTAVPLAVKLRAMCQIAEALGHAHCNGIVHRDIKPSNLFLSSDNTAKVLDFGIARLPSSKLTVQGKILGTPNYMAPEQILDEPTGPHSDLFSAGVVFFEFLTFAHPFHADLIPHRIAEGAPDSLFQHDSTLPLDLEAVFTRALARNPASRYPTGEDFAAALRSVLDQLQAVPSSQPTQPKAAATPSTAVPADAYQTHLADLMRIAGEFERAVSAGDTDAAIHAFDRMEALGVVDPRIADAVAPCRARLDALRDSSRTTTLRAAIPQRPHTHSSTKPCNYCGAVNRRAAAFCIACGGRILNDPESQPLVPFDRALANPSPPDESTTTITKIGETPVGAPAIEPLTSEEVDPPVLSRNLLARFANLLDNLRRR